MTSGDSPVALPAFARRIGADFELRLKVIPGASSASLANVLDDRLKIRVAEPPEDGKTNRAVVELLEDWLVGASVELVSGHGTPLKTVRVRGIRALPDWT
ncbi:MAG TPA: DUF167 domain-containing protein [Planctomycetota bacterium]|nr:DUF167 domain-containing protein [Planctomycetota bacterium]